MDVKTTPQQTTSTAAERAKVPHDLSAAILDAVENPEPIESLDMW
jgi:hypothetical protein